jgi:branched-chain amino acid transport system ATP-binding protein
MLELHDVKAAYGAAPALWGVSLHVQRGELLAVVGPNGAGKTTLIHTIAGLHRVAGGGMSIDGRDLTTLPPHRYCDAGIAIVPEGRRLFGGMTVRENLELGSFLPRARVRRKQSFDDVLALFPVLRPRLGSAAGELSGGQQQMLAIARALMALPRLLLLDEPSLGLSPLVVHETFDAIRRINASGTTVMLVEQNVAMAMQVSQRAYVLEEGRIVAEGAPAELAARPEIQRAYLGL